MYYVGKNGSQSGPYPLEELKNMAASGQLAPPDLVWTDGMSEWKPAAVALPDLFPNPAAAAAAPPSPITQGSSYPTAPSLPPQPTMAQTTVVLGDPIPTYLWQSIVVTLICCQPLGIPAIIFSTQVESKRQHGDIEGALKSSKNAKMWCWIALIAALVCGLGTGLLCLVFASELRHMHF